MTQHEPVEPTETSGNSSETKQEQVETEAIPLGPETQAIIIQSIN